MIIKDSSRGNILKPKKKHTFKWGKKWITLLVLIVLTSACFIASEKIKGKGYTNLFDFAKTVSVNFMNGLSGHPEEISIEIKPGDLKILEKNRQQALERGVIINDMDGEFVPAHLEYQGKKMKVKLRLKGHMTDHLQDNKWSFRIKIKDKGSFMGMKRFSIQHPGTRGYIYEWIYHELMKKEGIIALRYKFINVSVNGKNWGIYAVEENFEKELIENNSRPPGPIIRFNPDLYWVHRYNLMKKQSFPDEFASYYSANPEAYQEEEILGDPIQRDNYKKAILLVEGVRSRKVLVHEAFDIPLLAKFHAIIDIVGGQHAIDWSDIKYYYNSQTKKLEPVAYESFSSFPVKALSAMYKYSTPDTTQNYNEWHAALFSDPIFFKEYVKELERVSSSAYLDEFFSDANQELKKNLSILYKEFPYKKFDKEVYYSNQKKIKQMLNPPQAIMAYLKDTSSTQLTIQIANIESMPVEIHGVIINDRIIKPVFTTILDSKQPNAFLTYQKVGFNLPVNLKFKDSTLLLLKISYSILGSSILKQQHVFSFEHPEVGLNKYSIQGGNLSKFECLNIDGTEKIISFKKGKQVVLEDMLIPEGYKIIVNAGVSVDLRNKAKIITNSPIFFLGTEQDPVIFQSSDLTGEGLIIANTGANTSIFNYTKFVHLNNGKTEIPQAGIFIIESDVIFKNCNFSKFQTKNGLYLLRSNFTYSGCLFNEMKETAMNIWFSKGIISDCVFENCGNAGIASQTSNISMKSLYFNNNLHGLIVKGGTQVIGEDMTIKKSGEVLSATGNSKITLSKVNVEDVRQAFTIDTVATYESYSEVKLSGLVLKNVKIPFLKNKSSAVIVDNKSYN